jgi:hypothetical protein
MLKVVCSFYYMSITRLPHLRGSNFPYFICTVMIATFKPPFSFPLTYIRPSIPVSQFPVLVPFLPSTRSKAFRLQPQSCNSQKCSSAVQGEFKANSTAVALYLRKYTKQTSTERNARFQVDVPQHRRRILKHQLNLLAPEFYI